MGNEREEEEILLHLSLVLEGILCRKEFLTKTTLPLPGCTVLLHYEKTFIGSKSMEKNSKEITHTFSDGRFCVYTVLSLHLFHRAHS